MVSLLMVYGIILLNGWVRNTSTREKCDEETERMWGTKPLRVIGGQFACNLPVWMVPLVRKCGMIRYGMVNLGGYLYAFLNSTQLNVPSPVSPILN